MATDKGGDLTARLLAWYDRHRRTLPWRAAPGETPDPYHVWLSEIMLQQTTVAAVQSYFRDFLARWPRLEDLAAAPRERVLEAWAGLGYYARARNLHACAVTVAGEHGGRFPDTAEGLRQLPGIGPYTAGAIAAIAFGRREAAVDGNVERVISRLDAIETPLPAAKPAIRARTLSLVPQTRAGDFAQALMDIGATVCTPRAPDCLLCPWAQACAARRRGDMESFPRKQLKAATPLRRGTAWWLENAAGEVLLRRRPDDGLLGGMLEVPSAGWDGVVMEMTPPVEAHWESLGQPVTHTFTHFRLELSVTRAIAARHAARDGEIWVSREVIATAALPTVMRKVVAAVWGAAVLKPKRSR